MKYYMDEQCLSSHSKSSYFIEGLGCTSSGLRCSAGQSLLVISNTAHDATIVSNYTMSAKKCT